MSESHDRIIETMARHSITVTSGFVPLSQSRNKGEKHPTLNWRITVNCSGRAVLTTDYSAGMAHCNAYRQGKLFAPDMEAIRYECETGKKHHVFGNAIYQNYPTERNTPDPADVIYSLSLDADALNYGTFEEWARDFGYDADSRSAETVYRACLEIALKLRNGLGDAVLAELKTACEGY